MNQSELAYLCEGVRNRCRNVIARKTLTERVTHLYALEQKTETAYEETERLDRLQAFIDGTVNFHRGYHNKSVCLTLWAALTARFSTVAGGKWMESLMISR